MSNSYLTNQQADEFNNLLPGNQNILIGSKIQASLRMGVEVGTKYYLDAVNGKDSNDGLSATTPVQSLAIAYAKLTANKNDILYILGGASSIPISSAFTWAKSYTHLIGVCSNIRMGGRARITHNADFTPLFTISAAGCVFANIHIQHGRGNAANLVNVKVTGLRNFFYGCHFEGPLHATEAGAAFKELQIAISAQANTFERCSIGAWSIQATTNTSAEIEMLGDNADTYFKDCIINCYNSNTGHTPVKAGVNLGGEASNVTFENCKFFQLDNDKTLTKIVDPPTQGSVILVDCKAIRATDWSTAADVHVFVINSAVTENGGIGVNPS